MNEPGIISEECLLRDPGQVSQGVLHLSNTITTCIYDYNSESVTLMATFSVTQPTSGFFRTGVPSKTPLNYSKALASPSVSSAR